MTRKELITKIQIKMDADTSGSDDYYANYYNELIDECLSVVANTVLPYQKTMTYNWGEFIEDVSDLEHLSENCYYAFGADMEITLPGESKSQSVKRKDWLVFRQGKWTVQKKNTYGVLVDIPSDFLSFSDEASVEFIDTFGDLKLNVDVLYVNSKTLALSTTGDYTIYYNADYPSISSVNDSDNITWLPTNVGMIIPSYVAGQLLTSEDPIKATQLKNEFELMLSRLDANKPLVAYNITNTTGWI